MSVQSVLLRLNKFFFPSFSNGNHSDFICADTKNCHRDNKLSRKKNGVDWLLRDFFFSMGVMEGLTYNETVDRLKTLYWPTLKACWMIWPAVMVSASRLPGLGCNSPFLVCARDLVGVLSNCILRLFCHPKILGWPQRALWYVSMVFSGVVNTDISKF